MMNLVTKDNASFNLGYGKANVGASWADNAVGDSLDCSGEACNQQNGASNVAPVAAPAAPGSLPMGFPGAMGVPTGAFPVGVPTGAFPMSVPTGAFPTGVPTGAMPMGYKSMGYADVKDNGFSLSGSYGGFSGGIKTDDNATVCDSRGNCIVTDQL
jgi:hypothetical protein